jgi:hypothetical protein
MYYSYVEIEFVATSFSPARTDLALKLLSCKRCNMMVIKSLARHLDAYITGTPIPPQEQMAEERVEAVEQQRVIDITPITTHPAIQRVSNTPVMPTAPLLCPSR